MNRSTIKLYFCLKFLFLLLVLGGGIIVPAYSQTMGIMAAPPADGGNDDDDDGGATCTSITLKKISEDCNGAVLQAYPPKGCTFNYNLIGPDSKAAKGEVVNFTVKKVGSYRLRAWDEEGEYFSEYISVSLVEEDVWEPKFTISSRELTCPGDKVTLETTLSERGVKYEFYKGADLLQTKSGTGSKLTFGEYGKGSYKIKATKVIDPNTCKSNVVESDVLTIRIVNYSAPTISVTNLYPCEGQSTTIRTDYDDAGIYYLFRNGAEVTRAKDGLFTVEEGGSYQIGIDIGCGPANLVLSEAKQVTYQTNENVTVSISSDKDEVCHGEPVTFSVSVTNGGASSTYTWKVNGEEYHSRSSSITVQTEALDGNYVDAHCTVNSNATGCVAGKTVSTSKRIQLVPAVIDEVETETNSCGSLDDFYFKVINSSYLLEYTLMRGEKAVGDPQVGDGEELVFAIPSEGDYTIKAERLNGCGEPAYSAVHSFIITEVTIVTDYSRDQCTGSGVVITASGTSNIEAFTWYDDRNNMIGSGSSFSTVVEEGKISFRLKGITDEGCVVDDHFTFTLNRNHHKPDRNPYMRLREDKTTQLYLNNENTAEYQYYWVVNATDEVQAKHQEPRTVSEPGYYYVRSVDSKGCWGPAVSVYVPDFSAPSYPGAGLSQENINYVKTYTYQQKAITADPASLPAEKVLLSTAYLDGLGKPVQSVDKQHSPEGRDLVVPVFYDALGRQEKQFLAYEVEGGSGNVVAQPFTAQETFYQSTAKVAEDAFPFNITLFEPSPLNRVTEQGAPGYSWQPGVEHTIELTSRANTAAEEVIVWLYEEGEGQFGKVIANGYYLPNELFVTETEDEDGNLVKEYKNKEGQVILKDVADENGEPHRSYYIYDDKENLRIVFPPAFLDAWKESGGIAEDPNNYDGYKVVKQTATLTGNQENGKYYVAEGQTLIMGSSFNSGARFHATMGQHPEYVPEALLRTYAFYYHYDTRKRMVEKHVPGGGVTYLVYDRWDRLVLTQDPVQRKEHAWLYTKYDALSRPVVSGLWNDALGRERVELQEAVSGVSNWYEEKNAGAEHGYSLHNTFPDEADPSKVLTVTYYDDYTFLATAAYESNAEAYAYDALPLTDSEGEDIFLSEAFEWVKGQVTGTKTRVLGTDSWIKAANYYDDKYRLIQVVANNRQGGLDRLSSAYDFAGKTTYSLLQHAGVNEVNVLKEFVYDHAGRLLQSWQSINGQERVLLAQNEYNALGALVDKKLHSEDEGGNFLQSVDYRYNIRGWLTSINNSSLSSPENNDDSNDFFGMELGYVNDFGLGAEKLNHNGNISAIKWSANMGLNAAEKERAYTYSYDGLNRIKGADFQIKGAAWSSQDAYQLSGITYDKNGNIQSLQRKGADGNAMDRLTYDYGNGGNRLFAVSDEDDKEVGFKDGNTSGYDYDYDENGNLTEDKNKNISEIRYNHLNLPEEVLFADGSKITYIYDAAGTKLSQLVEKEGEEPKLTEYIGGLVYENDQLQFIQHEEGRVMYKVEEENPFEYQYHLKDHLGNVRMSFTSQEKVEEVVATMETVHEEEEWSQFLHYEEVTKINTELFDHTGEGGTFYSMRLSGAEGEQIGLAKSLSVNPGDVISAKVFAKYLDPETGNWSEALANLMAGIASGTAAAGTIVDGVGISHQDFGFAGMLTKAEDGEEIKAYLNVLIVDKNLNFLDGGFKAVGTAAKEEGSNVPHQELSSRKFTITQPGFVYIWLSNEGEEPVEVYFDDFTVTHEHSKVIQGDDYYPFGLTHAGSSFQRESSLKNKYLYNGKELQEDLGLDMYDYGARMYMPDLGRWNAIDPMSDAYSNFSPYQHVLNNPIANTDVGGKWTISNHHRMTRDALTGVGFGKRQANLIAWYTSVYADNPGGKMAWNNLVHPFYLLSSSPPSGRDMSLTANSQVTDWYPGIGHQNYNIWHSMRSPWEKNSGWISAEGAMDRGMRWGWSQIFESAKSGKLSEMRENGSGIQQFGQGLHALQDGYAHEGISIEEHGAFDAKTFNDRRGDTSKAEGVTSSAILVHSIMSNDFETFDTMLMDGKNTIDPKGMTGNNLVDLYNKMKEKGNTMTWNWETGVFDVK